MSRAAPRGAAPTPCRARGGCSCPCAPARGTVAIIGLDSASETGPAADAGPAAAAGFPVRPGGAGDRAGASGRGMPTAPASPAETEKLRSALLTSISHDLRTPLASILGSATSLRQYRAQLERSRPGRTARHHPGRSRAAEPFHRQSAGHDAAGIRRAGAAAGSGGCRPMWWARCCGGRRSCCRRHRVMLELDDGLPMVRLDPVLFEQVLFNLLDNAAKYAPPGSVVTIARGARRRAGAHRCDGRRRGHARRRPRTHLRQILPGAGRRPQTRRHRAWALPSAAASWKRWAAPSPPPIAAIAPARCSRLTLPVAGHDARCAF